MLVDNNVMAVAEGANMPCTERAQQAFKKAKVVFVPGKASNAGGVALSGLEMAQNAVFSQDDANTLDAQLKTIMQDIHYRCEQEGTSDSGIDYAKGANVAAFRRVADAMVAQGV